jgi:hypothetical protein
MGVHCERLATSKAHSRFVGGTKAALQKWALEKLHREIPIAAISPRAIAGAQLRLPSVRRDAFLFLLI